MPDTTGVSVQPEPGQIQAGADRRRGSSYELDVTDTGFRFPQTWRTSIGVDRRLPWGMIGTVDFIYNSDLQRSRLHQREPARARVGVHRRR